MCGSLYDLITLNLFESVWSRESVLVAAAANGELDLYRNPANAQGQVVKYSPGNQIDIEAQIGDPWLFLVDRLTSKIPKSLRSAFNDMRICHEGSAHYKKKSVYGRLTIQLDLFYYANADPEKWLRHADGRLSAVQAVGPDMLLSEFRTWTMAMLMWMVEENVIHAMWHQWVDCLRKMWYSGGSTSKTASGLACKDGPIYYLYDTYRTSLS